MTDKKTVYLGGQVSEDVHLDLLKIAQKEDKSLSAVIRTALCEYVKNKKQGA